MPTRRCFVISPIGQPGPDVRDHIDDLFRYVIQPAMDELGFMPHPADHDNQVGRISEQMFRSILSDDLCVAVLTFRNPNVFYELAVAQAAARPVVILSQRGTPLPFDITDLRVIEYDFRPHSIMQKVYVRQIVDTVRNLEAQGWKVPVPFGPHLTPLGGAALAAVRLLDRVDAYGPSDDWLALIAGATRVIDLSGISLRYWTRIPAFRSLLAERAKAGCRVRVMLMHPDNPAFLQYMNPRLKLTVGTSEIEATTAFFAELAADHAGVEVRRMRTTSRSFGPTPGCSRPW